MAEVTFGYCFDETIFFFSFYTTSFNAKKNYNRIQQASIIDPVTYFCIITAVN